MVGRRVKVRATLRNTCKLEDDVDEGITVGSEAGKENRPSNLAGSSGKQKKKGKSLSQSGVAGPAETASKRQQKRSSAALKNAAARSPKQPATLVNATKQESPPAFAFKQGKTRFRKRKLFRREQQEQHSEADEKRIRELIAYFAKVDEQRIEVG